MKTQRRRSVFFVSLGKLRVAKKERRKPGIDILGWRLDQGLPFRRNIVFFVLVDGHCGLYQIQSAVGSAGQSDLTDLVKSSVLA